MVAYLTRDKWTSTSAGGSTLTGTKLVGVAVHWPGSTTSAYGVETQDKVASRLRGWRDYHVNGRGWSDIGYNFAIDQAGRVWQCRTTDWKGNRVGAHCASASNPDANQEYVGVLLILGANEKPSAAMIQAFQDWRWKKFIAGWGSKTDLRGHGQVPGASTSCPGSAAKALISDGTLAKRPPTTEVSNVSETDVLNALKKSIEITSPSIREWREKNNQSTSVPTRWMIEWSWYYGYVIRRQVVANAKMLTELTAQVAALSEAVKQLGSNNGVDLTAVQAAAKAGAEAALDAIDFDFSVTATPDVEP